MDGEKERKMQERKNKEYRQEEGKVWGGEIQEMKKNNEKGKMERNKTKKE